MDDEGDWVMVERLDVPARGSALQYREAVYDRHPYLRHAPQRVRIDIMCGPDGQALRFWYRSPDEEGRSTIRRS